jgi:hypothetical protein
MAVTNLSNQHISASYQNLVQISSSNALYNGTGSLIPNLAVTASFALSASYFAGNSVSASYVKLAQSASYVLLAKSASFATTASYNSGNSISASYTVTASYAVTATTAQTASFNLNSVSASYAATASQAPLYLPLTGGTISGNLTVNGTASFAYTTASYFEIGANRIQLNTALPSSRFAGITVFDSGSVQKSGSLFFDSLNDQWLFIHQGASATATSSLLIMGPETYGNIGNETNLTNNKIPKSVNAEHIGDSNITDTGTLVTIASNSVVSGSLVITGSNTLIGNKTVTGSVFILGNKTITGSVFISGSKTVIGADTITGSLSVSGSITSTSGFIKSGSGSQILLADGTTSTNGTLFKTGSVAYGTAASTTTIVSTPLTTSQFADFDTIQFNSIVNTPVDAVAVVLIEIYINGSPNMTGSPVKLATYNGPLANRHWWFDRTFYIQGGTINVRNANSSNSTSVGTFGSAMTSVSLPSPTFYLIMQITTTSTDTARASVITIQKI